MPILNKIKSAIFRKLNPIRRAYNALYSFVLASYLGQIIIQINHIDHLCIDWIFYFFVFSPKGKGVNEFYKIVNSVPLGPKLDILKQIHVGNLKWVIKHGNKDLRIDSSVFKLKNNKTLDDIIKRAEKVNSDTRNPLVHSEYSLGFGNNDTWALSYHRMYFNKTTGVVEFPKISIIELKKYLTIVKTESSDLQKLWVKLLNEMHPITP